MSSEEKYVKEKKEESSSGSDSDEGEEEDEEEEMEVHKHKHNSYLEREYARVRARARVKYASVRFQNDGDAARGAEKPPPTQLSDRRDFVFIHGVPAISVARSLIQDFDISDTLATRSMHANAMCSALSEIGHTDSGSEARVDAYLKFLESVLAVDDNPDTTKSDVGDVAVDLLARTMVASRARPETTAAGIVRKQNPDHVLKKRAGSLAADEMVREMFALKLLNMVMTNKNRVKDLSDFLNSSRVSDVARDMMLESWYKDPVVGDASVPVDVYERVLHQTVIRIAHAIVRTQHAIRHIRTVITDKPVEIDLDQVDRLLTRARISGRSSNIPFHEAVFDLVDQVSKRLPDSVEIIVDIPEDVDESEIDLSAWKVIDSSRSVPPVFSNDGFSGDPADRRVGAPLLYDRWPPPTNNTPGREPLKVTTPDHRPREPSHALYRTPKIMSSNDKAMFENVGKVMKELGMKPPVSRSDYAEMLHDPTSVVVDRAYLSVYASQPHASTTDIIERLVRVAERYVNYTRSISVAPQNRWLAERLPGPNEPEFELGDKGVGTSLHDARIIIARIIRGVGHAGVV